ncbi:serine/threonine-protein kinase [Stigmatella sp. ncwal1]|uniref:Serine/threonine-protein kinase n=1 Tax=Stigmatella ashevillensis TaxID=2995309 RepID=A0ABT5DHT7_9BACT|nr:serine/threonine-protein kinase [Stigmatella ashevillena]MDC0712659.1 serine/threonine-protein kinase [Stigmatella ashevillena]
MRIQQYELIRQLGAGGMGTVFLARDTKLGRRVAIKLLQTRNPAFTHRFILEARATARCSHENIVVIYEVGEFQGSPFMVLEFLQGQSLQKLVSGQRLPPSRVVELLAPVVRALECAHAEGIVHRDLKPDNILVTDAGTVKVLDFGIAKVLHGQDESPEKTRVAQVHTPEGAGVDLSNLTQSGALVGTVPYMSPEQWGNGVSVDLRTDIWALGILLFRMLAGRHPLEPLRGPQLAVTAFLDEPMPRLRDVAPDVPAALADVVDRCLLKRKEERFPDAASVLRALEPFLPGRYSREMRIDESESPYAGLSSFQESNAALFFGRSKEIGALMSRIRDRPLMAVVGPSGAGKSSFVRAGLVPFLKRSGDAWESLVLRPGRDPLGALASVVAPLMNSSDSLAQDLQEHQRLVARMREEPGVVGTVLRGRARRERKRLLLFIDQFEELYTQVADPRERQAFTACLSGIADDATTPMRVVLSIRSDFLDRVHEDERFMGELSQGLFFLTAPNQEGLRDALVQPAEMAGYRFESPEMISSMLEHLNSTEGALPLLQFAATQLWEQRDPARKLLTQQSYIEMGGIAGALATHADSVLDKMTPSARVLVRSLFLRLVTPERTRAIVSMEELQELSRDTVELQLLTDQLVQARLLVVQTGSGATGATVEIVHESLIHRWPTLHRWLEENQDDSAFLEQLRTAARQWHAKGRDSGLLWRGEMVEEAQRFQRRFRGELPQVQLDFLSAVGSQAARATRWKRALVVGSMVFLSVLVAASLVALLVIRESKKEAERQAMEARQAQEVAQQSLAVAEAREKAQLEAQRKEEEARRKEEEAKGQLAAAYNDLQRTNGELEGALRRAKYAQWRARVAMKSSDKNAAAARRNADAARRAEERAIRMAKDLEKRLLEEKERIRRMEDQLGKSGPVPSLELGLDNNT